MENVQKIYSEKDSESTYFLFLDDIRNPKDVTAKILNDERYLSLYQSEWVIVRSYNEFVKLISKKGLPEFISFDHDLGEKKGVVQPTGMDCAKWLVDYCLDNNKPLPFYRVHSANPAGAANIVGILESFKKHQSENNK